MARMRTIKPEFWTSEPIVALTPFARLLFIGLWNFCDDGGVHPASLARLKMEVLPNDLLSPEEMEKLLGELTRRQPNGEPGLVLEFTGDDGKAYWFVRSFAEHQKPEKPTIRFPQYVPGKSPPKNGEPVPAPKLAGADSEHPRGEVAEQSPSGRRGIGYGKGIGKGSGGENKKPGSEVPARPRSVGAMVGPVIRSESSEPGLSRARNEKPTRSPGAFDALTDGDLRSTERLVRWWERESRSSNPVVGRAELDRLNVLAAAERSIEVARRTKGNGVALFARIVSGKLWRLISNEQEERARLRLLAWRRELAAREREGSRPEGSGIIPPTRDGARAGGVCSSAGVVEIPGECLPGNVESLGAILARSFAGLSGGVAHV